MSTAGSDGTIGLAGHVIDAPSWDRLRSWPDGALVVESGRVAAVGPVAELRRAWPHADWRGWAPGVRPVIVPGLIDVHAHVPQYPEVARAEDGLLPWLERRVFPTEARFRAGRALLREELDAFFAELAAHGTTTAMLYAAVWGDSCHLAFEAAERSGLRVLMGKVMMDVGSYGRAHDLPADEARQLSADESRTLIDAWHGRDGGRLEYVLSPRFAVSCSMDLMREAAQLAAERGCAIQTHLSENRDEVASVAARFPEARDYTDVYRRAGLLTPRTVLGHCLHLSASEIDALAAARACVAHCPTSNLFLGSGLCPLDRLRAAGVRIGLGSDVAAGPELNLWQVMRSAVETQKVRRMQDQSVPELTAAQAFFLATQGGADVVGQGKSIGTFDPGREADVLVLDLNAVLPYGGRFAAEITPLSAEEIIALCVYRGGPAATVEARVRGRVVPRSAARGGTRPTGA
jgi:guanine deaminase